MDRPVETGRPRAMDIVRHKLNRRPTSPGDRYSDSVDEDETQEGEKLLEHFFSDFVSLPS
jgi:hypothetical protein